MLNTCCDSSGSHRKYKEWEGGSLDLTCGRKVGEVKHSQQLFNVRTHTTYTMMKNGGHKEVRRFYTLSLQKASWNNQYLKWNQKTKSVIRQDRGQGKDSAGRIMRKCMEDVLDNQGLVIWQTRRRDKLTNLNLNESAEIWWKKKLHDFVTMIIVVTFDAIHKNQKGVRND